MSVSAVIGITVLTIAAIAIGVAVIGALLTLINDSYKH